ncbi:glycosyltransferase family 2 protein [Vibrio sp. Isolate34]|uniref:glycosyltransferase family 2 protein n=1 Tax=Vibrio sp. Isolate34 TaxID=2908540 RepID=UPI001EFC3583|nr:glycosyltransferase family A protein [Vibrio sp. Isolate34]MCG9639515.1 glycosyltransferase family 2 protein [Vibrio sp. Isolate34]
MKVSVIIPTKNRISLLQRAVDSVLIQLNDHDEIIIVDDASDFDVSSLFLDSRIKVIRNSFSKGGAVSRNIGVAESNNECIMFLDDDDSWENGKVKKQLSLLKNKETVIVFSGKKVVWDTDLDKPFRNIKPGSEEYSLSDILSCNHIGSTSSVAIRKDDFIKVNGFDPELPCFQDYDLWIRLLTLGTAVYDGENSVIYTVFRKKGKQISRSNDGRHEIAASYLLKKYSPGLNDKDIKKFKSNLYQLVSKALNVGKPLKSLQFSIVSFAIRPSLRALKFIFGSCLALVGYKHG